MLGQHPHCFTAPNGSMILELRTLHFYTQRLHRAVSLLSCCVFVETAAWASACKRFWDTSFGVLSLMTSDNHTYVDLQYSVYVHYKVLLNIIPYLMIAHVYTYAHYVSALTHLTKYIYYIRRYVHDYRGTLQQGWEFSNKAPASFQTCQQQSVAALQVSPTSAECFSEALWPLQWGTCRRQGRPFVEG